VRGNACKNFALCIRNDGDGAWLELRKLYIVDEEDYLYPASYFAAVERPLAVERYFFRDRAR
jgi:hypothetical protein